MLNRCLLVIAVTATLCFSKTSSANQTTLCKLIVANAHYGLELGDVFVASLETDAEQTYVVTESSPPTKFGANWMVQGRRINLNNRGARLKDGQVETFLIAGSLSNLSEDQLTPISAIGRVTLSEGKINGMQKTNASPLDVGVVFRAPFLGQRSFVVVERIGKNDRGEQFQIREVTQEGDLGVLSEVTITASAQSTLERTSYFVLGQGGGANPAALKNDTSLPVRSLKRGDVFCQSFTSPSLLVESIDESFVYSRPISADGLPMVAEPQVQTPRTLETVFRFARVTTEQRITGYIPGFEVMSKIRPLHVFGHSVTRLIPEFTNLNRSVGVIEESLTVPALEKPGSVRIHVFGSRTGLVPEFHNVPGYTPAEAQSYVPVRPLYVFGHSVTGLIPEINEPTGGGAIQVSSGTWGPHSQDAGRNLPIRPNSTQLKSIK